MDREYRSLVAMILHRAMIDWRNTANGKSFHIKGMRINRDELREFFYSEWCRELCVCISFPHKTILEFIDNG